MSEDVKPRLALWLKYHRSFLRWLPFGGCLWRWSIRRVDRWHDERGIYYVKIGDAKFLASNCQVLVNTKPVEPGTILRPGDSIEVRLCEFVEPT